MIVPNNINYSQVSAITQTLTGRVSSADEVIAIICADFQGGSANSLTAKFNGVNIPQASVGIQATGLCLSVIFIVWNPPVGSYSIVLADANASVLSTTVMSLLGVSKRSQTPINANTSSASTPASLVLPVQVASANSIIIDCLTQNDATTAITAGGGQTQIMNLGDTGGNNYGSSYKFASPGLQSMSWTLTTTNTASYALVVLEPDDAPSIWYPNIQPRSEFDVAGPNNLSTGGAKGITGTNGSTGVFGYHPTTFWQNSFLHTVGRVLPPSTAPSPAAELERPTSKIIIDQISQGQAVGNGITAATLNIPVSIPSSDTTLVVTGGNVVATGLPFASMVLDGTPLIQLIQTAVAGADAEIWWLPNPSVGNHTLTVVGGNALSEVYVNAMSILGLDSSTTPIVASITDAASTSVITVPIIPVASNSLIIDTISTLNATAAPVADQSQNQVFNGSRLASNENLISTYKIGNTTGEQMSYSLTVAANAALVAVAFKPVHSTSLWYPNITNRNLDDTVDTNGLDASFNPAFGTYGYKPSSFYLNSFVPTVGRYSQPKIVATAQQPLELQLTGIG